MPLQINVGLNRKASKDYQSTGVSINIQAELDATLLARPDELQRQVADLYAQAEAALERQVGSPAVVRTPATRMAPVASPVRTAAPASTGGFTAPRPTQAPAAATRWAGRTGQTAGRVDGGNTPPAATDSQIKAIRAIAQTMGLDAEAEADALGFKFPLGRGDASRLIDHLKSLQQPRAAA